MSYDRSMVECWACGEPVVSADLAVCGACGLRFAPRRGEDEVHDLYDDGYFERYAGGAYDEHEAERRYESARRVELLRSRCPAPGRLLELGPAAGYFLEAAAAAGWQVCGLEAADGEAQRARARGLDVRTGYLVDEPLPESDLDAVCAWHVVEHIPEPLAPLRRVRDALRPGGRLLVEVPNAGSVAAGRMGPDWPHWDHTHHVSHFTPDAMRALLGRAGFTDVEVWSFPFDGYLPVARLLRPVQFAAKVRETLWVRALPRRPHPWRHELVRAVATRP